MENQGGKCVFLGESGVGKTSLIDRITHGTFSDNLCSTTGASYASLIMHRSNGCLCLWDTAGQEKYRCLTKAFVKDATILAFVYDITRKSSFEELKNYWIPQMKEERPDAIPIILANKSDLFDQEEVTLNEATQYTNENNIRLIEVSAKDDMGIETLKNYFEDICLYGKDVRNENYKNKQNELQKKTIEVSEKSGGCPTCFYNIFCCFKKKNESIENKAEQLQPLTEER